MRAYHIGMNGGENDLFYLGKRERKLEKFKRGTES